MAGHFAYFKKDGKVVKAGLNTWARHRRSGYAFATLKEFLAQKVDATEEVTEEETVEVTEEETVELPTMENTKAEILAFAEEYEVEVNAEDTKADLIEALDDALA